MNNDDTDRDLKNQLQVRNDETTILESLYKSLETLVTLELAYQYYVSPEIIPVLLRTSLINSFIPETATTLFRLPIVLAVNILCILLHFFGESPAPLTDGSKMLSGGVLTDFVGEFAHSSRFKLILLDMMIMGIMILMMVAGSQKKKVETRLNGPAPAQDLEAEEEGIRRSTEQENATTAERSEEQTLLELESLPVTDNVRLDVAAGIRRISTASTPETTVMSDDRREVLRGLLRTLADRTNPR